MIQWMKRLTLIWAMLGATMGLAEPSIPDVISQQIAAFAAKDETAAYAHASPMIQSKFKTPQAFVDMVQSAYPVIWEHEKVLFLQSAGRGSMIFQEVTFIDKFGTNHNFYYQMIKLDDVWRIDGVFEHPQTGNGV